MSPTGTVCDDTGRRDERNQMTATIGADRCQPAEAC